MSSTLTDTMHAANNGREMAKDGAIRVLGKMKDELESTRESTMHTVTNTLFMILKGVSATAAIVTTLRKLDRDDGLAWLGLSRRRSPLLPIAILGVGAALGVGIALWFAPMAGADLRSALMGRTKDTAKRVETST